MDLSTLLKAQPEYADWISAGPSMAAVPKVSWKYWWKKYPDLYICNPEHLTVRWIGGLYVIREQFYKNEFLRIVPNWPHRNISGTDLRRYAIYCSICHIYGPWKDTEAEAVEAWNIK